MSHALPAEKFLSRYLPITLMEDRASMGLCPASRILRRLQAANSSGRHVSRLWLNRSSCKPEQSCRPDPRVSRALWPRDSFPQGCAAPCRLRPRVCSAFPLSTSVFSRGILDRPAQRITLSLSSWLICVSSSLRMGVSLSILRHQALSISSN